MVAGFGDGRECLASPLGYLYTRVTDWPSSQVLSADGDIVEVSTSDVPASALGEPGDWTRG